MPAAQVKFPLFNKIDKKVINIYSTDASGDIVQSQKVSAYVTNELQVTENENVLLVNGFFTISNLGTIDKNGDNASHPIAISYDGFVISTSNVAIQTGIVSRLKGYTCPLGTKDTLQATCEIPDGKNYIRAYVENPNTGSGLNIRSKDINTNFSMAFSLVYQKQL